MGTPSLGIPSVGKIVDRLLDLSGYFAGFCVLGMGVSVFTEVVMRYVFNRPTVWSLELTECFMVMGAFWGAAYTLKEGRQIIIDFLINLLVKKTRVMLEIVTLLGVLIFSGILLWYGLEVLGVTIGRGEVTWNMHMPMWIPRSAVPIAGGLLILQVLRMLFSRVSLLYKGEAGAGIPIGRLSLQNPAILLPLYIGVLGAEIWLLTVNPILAMVLLTMTLLFGGVPIGFALGLAGCIMLEIVIGGGGGLPQSALVAYKSVDSFVLAAIPLFIFGASVMARGGLADQMYNMVSKWIGHLPGGMAMASVGACGIFACITGSSTATAATIGLIAIPIMLGRGYNKGLVYGVIATGGTLGSLIPPSLTMIMYASITEVSVGQLFMAGFIPGLIEMLCICLLILFFCRRGRNYVPTPPASWKERFLSMKTGIFAIGAPVIILGGIYTGVFTPTEAAAVALMYGLAVGGIILRRLKWKELKETLLEAVKTTVMILTIIIGALILGHLITYLRVPEKLMMAVAGLHPWAVMIAINLFLLVLGCMVEGVAMLMTVIPVVFPVIVRLGFNPIWFGIVFTANEEVAMMTPPVGLNLFVIQGITGARFAEVLRGALPFALLQVFNLAVIMAFPILSTWLPNTMITR